MTTAKRIQINIVEAPTKKKTPFAATRQCKEFMHELMQNVVTGVGTEMTKQIPRENIQIFYHGMHWSFEQEDQSGFTTQTGKLQKQQTTVRLDIARIRAYDIALLPEFINQTVEHMDKQLQQRLFSMINEVTERSGNVTAVPKGGSIAKAALEALANIKLSVDAEGKVSPPSLFLNPVSLEQMSKEIAEDSATHAEAVRKILEQKQAEAFATEQERLSRYDASC
jgi:hypothetical protein